MAANFPSDATFRQQKIRCGKPNCKCNSPSEKYWHGPYWYAFWHRDGEMRSAYVGKFRDQAERDAHRRARDEQRAAHARRDEQRREERQRKSGDEQRRASDEQRRSGASSSAPHPSRDDLDAALLGVNPGAPFDELRRAWRRKIAEAHPDRVTDPREKAKAEERAKDINQAYQRMLKYRGWSGRK